MNEEEIWKDITGYEELYKISNFGKVKRIESIVYNKRGFFYIKKEKILKNRKSKIKNRDYISHKVILCKKGIRKSFLIHRLVAEAFVLNLNKKKQVNHIDENPENNFYTNLEWVTAKENSNHGTRNKRIALKNTNGKKSIKITQIKNGNIVKIWDSIQDTGRNGYIFQNVLHCCKGRRKTHKGYKWEYYTRPNDCTRYN